TNQPKSNPVNLKNSPLSSLGLKCLVLSNSQYGSSCCLFCPNKLNMFIVDIVIAVIKSPPNNVFLVLVILNGCVLASQLTSDCEKTHKLSNKYSKKLVEKMRKLYYYICNTSKEFPAISSK